MVVQRLRRETCVPAPNRLVPRRTGRSSRVRLHGRGSTLQENFPRSPEASHAPPAESAAAHPIQRQRSAMQRTFARFSLIIWI
eukprot:COSAG05_NODE_16378_length_347_cov_1.032258_1_plen_82_part_10